MICQRKTESEWAMRIQEAAETLGLTTETLRYYERVGLIGSVGRREGGQREYTDEVIEETRKVAALRRGGLSVEDLKKIKALLETGAKDEVSAFLGEKISECRERAKDAQDVGRALKNMKETMKWA